MEGNGYSANFRRFEIKYARIPMYEKYTADYKKKKKKRIIYNGRCELIIWFGFRFNLTHADPKIAHAGKLINFNKTFD